MVRWRWDVRFCRRGAERQRGRYELASRREEVEEGFGGADAQAAWMVQVERSDGGPARGGEGHEAGFLPGEMIRPEVLAWMVKRRGETGVGISGVRAV